MPRSLRPAGAAALLAAALLAACTPEDAGDAQEATTAAATEAPTTEAPTSAPASSEQETASAEEPTTADGTTEEPTEQATAPHTTEPATETAEEQSTAAEQTGVAEESAGLTNSETTAEGPLGPVTFTLPDGWQDLSFAGSSFPGSIINAAPLARASEGSVLALVASGGAPPNAQAYLDQVAAALPAGGNLQEAEPLAIGGESAPGLRSVVTQNGDEIVQHVHVVVRDGGMYEYMLWTTPGNEAADLAAFRELAGTLSFG